MMSKVLLKVLSLALVLSAAGCATTGEGYQPETILLFFPGTLAEAEGQIRLTADNTDFTVTQGEGSVLLLSHTMGWELAITLYMEETAVGRLQSTPPLFYASSDPKSPLDKFLETLSAVVPELMSTSEGGR